MEITKIPYYNAAVHFIFPFVHRAPALDLLQSKASNLDLNSQFSDHQIYASTAYHDRCFKDNIYYITPFCTPIFITLHDRIVTSEQYKVRMGGLYINSRKLITIL